MNPYTADAIRLETSDKTWKCVVTYYSPTTPLPLLS